MTIEISKGNKNECLYFLFLSPSPSFPLVILLYAIDYQTEPNGIMQPIFFSLTTEQVAKKKAKQDILTICITPPFLLSTISNIIVSLTVNRRKKDHIDIFSISNKSLQSIRTYICEYSTVAPTVHIAERHKVFMMTPMCGKDQRKMRNSFDKSFQSIHY